ncbi:alpha/beta fold hydrolase [Clostridium sp. Marseille-P299]|uniref:alpha/beta fold hydrolase n=1 Tax=Clostridium sp. Marseille-P299 TaxID=1805477 RepID=UPI00082FE590|nr:alpha/beta hydrolase [Clostridium sp. Marseille-P299]
MEHKQIKSQNGNTHYWIAHNKNATAKCIVFTHGLTANHTMFEKQVERFSSEYTVLTWDVPLHGLSRPYHDFSYEKTAIELHSILKNEGISKVILLGMSMGGYPSQMFASMFPEMVEGFIALDTTPFGMKYYSKTDLWWLKQVESMAKWFPDGMLRKSMAKSVSKSSYSYNKMLEMLQPLTKAEIIEQMGIAYGKFAAENKEVTFSFPVLILLGDSDKTGKVRKYCEDWSKRTSYPLHIIKNAAHFSNGDNSEQVNFEIEAFIQGL